MPCNDLIASMFAIARVGRDGKARVSLRDRVAHAAAAGFAGIGTTPDDYLDIRAEGLSDADIAAILAEHGVGIQEIDNCPVWVAVEDPDERYWKELDLVSHIAETFGPVHHTIAPIGARIPTMAPTDVMVDRLRMISERAEKVGLLVAVEFIPWGPVPDAGTAWQLAEATGHDACGVNVDFWHHLAGVADEAALRAVPGNRVHAVHLTDGTPDLSEPDPLRRTQLQRNLPGEGVFPMVDTIRLLDSMGVDVPYTVEVVSLAHRHLPPADYVATLYQAARGVIDDARGAHEGKC